MTQTTASLSADEVIALREIARAGTGQGATQLSCSQLGEAIGTSAQTASRRLQHLEDAGMVTREVATDGQWVEVTDRGEQRLRREHAAFAELFEVAPTRLDLHGTVTTGMGEGRHYIALDGYAQQFRERLGYPPYPGTLNLELHPQSVRARSALSQHEGTPIDAWESEDRTYGSATCYAAQLRSDAHNVERAHVIVPDRTHHDASQLEVIAPIRLREALALVDGDIVDVTIGADA
jgi:CTP-dependent riboflavin kinase (EC 2.7.1.-)